jgi:Xaa-Pro dipeptidase
MFDCHGTIDLYCWDGGKTWVVEGEPEGSAKRFADATARVALMLLSAMRPGARISELQAKGRDIYRREGVPDPASAVIFFHGLGLSHMDIEQRTADGKSNVDWMLEDGMVVPVHLLYPGRRARAVLAGGGCRYRERRRQTNVLVGIRTADAGRLHQTKSLEHALATKS